MPRLSESVRRKWAGRLFRTAGIAAIAGITLSLDRLFGALMDVGFNPAAMPWRTAAVDATILCGWGLIAFIARRWNRHGQFPSPWAVLGVVGLVWAAILLSPLPS